ncbi:branched-chain amino acid aminotransferase [Burkholderia orbicola]|uniref:branched-chain amino acid aminotransferase n=1 Tax=Burkholderia cepacia complex TaxID=87882 RepID=UPI002855A9EC|nr:branched-chain amino acid aminotransferase [Burkholderia cenocepacia]MDR5667006.1 branched-chain amino acid aminotransferase [Burkholderia cenocepacia]MDR5670019.1 branched-chain amino acid aminotransferase [Burkholderia cenocepacia]MDR8097816.1 branched-chain amino acid aminotransferase [Burkholderia cenocepacia]
MSTGSVQHFAFEQHPHPVPAAERAALLDDPGFGRIFTDHMVTIRYSAEQGWHDAKIGPREAFRFDPATLVLHYAQEIFEGLKAYRLPGGGAALFRPDANARRFRHSAERLSMAPLPEAMFVESVRALVRADRDWIPAFDGAALYLRPFMIATQAVLGVKPSPEYLYCVIATPVGAYFKSGAAGVTLWVSEHYTRAAPGGTGDAKCGGNYAASLAAQAEAIREGCEQVVFLDAVERRWIEELGGMNVFFVFDDGSIQTPPLNGTILPGITRASLITLARELNYTVREEGYTIEQWQADARSGRLVEAFACGTAAVVTAIGRVKGRAYDFTIGEGGAGPVTQRLKAALLDIQNGRESDRHGWVDRVF